MTSEERYRKALAEWSDVTTRLNSKSALIPLSAEEKRELRKVNARKNRAFNAYQESK